MQILQRSFSVILLLIFISAFTISAQDKFTTPSEIRGLSWSPDGTQIAIGFYNSDVEIIDAQTRNITMTLEADLFDVQQLAWSPNGNFLASASYDGNVIIWDTSNGDEVAIVNGLSGDGITALSWSPNNTDLVINQYGGFTIWDPVQHVVKYSETIGTAFETIWTTNTNELVLVLAVGDIDVRNTTTFQQISYIVNVSNRNSAVINVDLTSGDDFILLGSTVGNVQLWDLSTGQPIYEVQGNRSDSPVGSIRDVWFDNQDTVFYSLNTSGNLCSWSVASGELLTETIITNQPINFAAVSPDRTRLAYVTAGTSEIEIVSLP